MRRAVVAIVAALAALLVVAGPAGAAGQLEYVPADQTEGLDGFGAPGFGMDDQFTAGGKRIAKATAVGRQLACLEDAGATTRCYSTVAALAASENMLTPRASAARRRAGKPAHAHSHSHAHAANHPGDPLTVWQYAGQGGWSLSLYSSCAWYNLTGGYDNDVSSVYAGNHSFHLSGDYNGAGGWANGVAYGSYDMASASWGQLDNWASSRYRQGC